MDSSVKSVLYNFVYFRVCFGLEGEKRWIVLVGKAGAVKSASGKHPPQTDEMSTADYT